MRIGITMRITRADSYEEYRDSIAQDWNKFMASKFSRDQYMFIPNIEDSVTTFVRDWGIDMIFLSGGEDIGTDKSRDNTETMLIKYALDSKIPLVGVCRGMQMINAFFGDNTVDGGETFRKRHVAHDHEIFFLKKRRVVNSYHSRKITENSLGKGLSALGFDSVDGTVEALGYKHVLGLMWHPERERDIDKDTADIIINHIREYGK